MRHRSISASTDIDKTREELLAELEELRVRNAFLEQCEGRAEPLLMDTDLSQNESMTRLLLNQKLYGVWVNAGGKIAYINEVGAQILGVSNPAQIIGKSVLGEIIHPDYRNAVSDRIKAMCGGDTVEPLVEEKFIRVDGSIVDVDVWAINFIYRGELAFLVAFKDITDRKRAEEALRESEANLARAQAISHTGSWYVDPVTEVGSGSEEFFRILGIPWQDAFPYSEWFKLVHPDDRVRARAIFDRNKHAHGKEDFELRIIRPDGEERVIFTSGKIVPGKDGRPRLMGTIQDITERKRAEEALRDSQAHMSSIFRAAPTGIGVVVDRVISKVNDRLCEMTGYASEELMGKSARIFYPSDEDYEYVGREKYAQIERLGTGSVETRWRRKDGRVIDVLLSSTPLQPGNLGAGVTFTALDISERKRAEEALKSNEADLDRAQEIAHVGSWRWDKVSGKGEWTAEFYRILGYEPGEVEMSRKLYMSMVYPDDREMVIDNATQALAKDRPSSCEHRIVRRDGTIRHVHLMITSMARDRNGRPVGEFGTIQDITERKRAEEAVMFANAYNRSLIEASPDPLVTIAPDGRITDVNAATEAVTGYPREKLIGTDFSEYFTEPEKAREGYQKVYGEGRVTDYPLEIRCVDGHVTPVLYNATVYRDREGKVIGVFAAARDVAERKKAEEAIRLAGAYNRSLIEASLDPLVTIAPDGKITDVNRATEMATGVSREELIGTDFSEYFTEPDRAREGYLTVFEKGSVTDYPLEIRHREGHITPVLYNASVYWDEAGKVIGVFAAARDVTERRRAEEEIRRLATIVETSIDGITIQDFDGRVLAWNHGAEIIFGYSLAEVTKSGVRVIIPDDRVEEKRALVEELSRGTDSKSVETRRVTKDGRVLDIWLTLRTLKDVTGKPYAFTTIERDITERKRVEEKLRETKAQAELYLDLMGHDINNMHQIALGYLEMAQGLAPGVQQGEMIEKSVEILQRSTQLIRNVRKLQKLNEVMIQTHEVDVGGMLHAVQQEFGAMPGKNIRLSLNCDGGHCFVRANELLHDVFANLVGNAIKHTEDRADIVVGMDIVLENGRRYCRVSVEDNGPGVPDDFKASIFNRLSKGANKAKGMGLGLYLVKSLVESYGGRVWVEDRIAGDHTKGAKFVVMLPAVDV